MSIGITFATQKALYAAVSAAVAPVAVVDHGIENQPYPLVHLGRITAQPSNTLDARQTRLLVTFSVFSAYEGKMQLVGIVDQITAALDDAKLALESGAAVSCHVERWDVSEEGGEGAAVVRVGSVIVSVLVEH